MGLRRPSRTRPTWTCSIGAIAKVVAAGGSLKTVCAKCQVWRDVDPAPIIAKMGPDFDLYDRRPRCKEPGCPGRVTFMAGQPNTWNMPLKSV